MKYKILGTICLFCALYIEFLQYGFITALLCFFIACFAIYIGPYVWNVYKKIKQKKRGN